MTDRARSKFLLGVGVVSLFLGALMLLIGTLNTEHSYPPLWVLFVGTVGILQGAFAIRKYW